MAVVLGDVGVKFHTMCPDGQRKRLRIQVHPAVLLHRCVLTELRIFGQKLHKQRPFCRPKKN